VSYNFDAGGQLDHRHRPDRKCDKAMRTTFPVASRKFSILHRRRSVRHEHLRFTWARANPSERDPIRPGNISLRARAARKSIPSATRHVIYTNPRGKTRAEIQDLGGLKPSHPQHVRRARSSPQHDSPGGGRHHLQLRPLSNVLTTTLTPSPDRPWLHRLRPTLTTHSSTSRRRPPIRWVLVTQNSYDAGTGNLTASISDFGSPPHLNARRNFTYNNVGQVQTATDSPRLGNAI
jgi:hypothetical protein